MDTIYRVPGRVLRALPASVQRPMRQLRGWVNWARVQRPITRVLGPQYRRSRRYIEIDITWACNLRCFNCNRSCEQAPTGDAMTIDQVARFVDDSLAADLRWERIRVLGGEPTLHPEFLAILAELVRYHRAVDGAVRLEITTNGHGDKVRARIAQIPSVFVVENTAKESIEQPFVTFNVAPIDRREYRAADYRSGCWVTEGCGIGLTPKGYYPCAVAGGIDRIVGLDMGRDALPTTGDDLFDQLEAFCRMCGSFKRQHEPPVDHPVQSPTWERAYARHRRGGRAPTR